MARREEAKQDRSTGTAPSVSRRNETSDNMHPSFLPSARPCPRGRNMQHLNVVCPLISYRLFSHSPTNEVTVPLQKVPHEAAWKPRSVQSPRPRSTGAAPGTKRRWEMQIAKEARHSKGLDNCSVWIVSSCISLKQILHRLPGHNDSYSKRYF